MTVSPTHGGRLPVVGPVDPEYGEKTEKKQYADRKVQKGRSLEGMFAAINGIHSSNSLRI